MKTEFCRIIKDTKTNEIFGIFTNMEECDRMHNIILKRHFKDMIKSIEHKINNSIANNETLESNLVYDLKNLKFTYKMNEDKNEWTIDKPKINNLTIDRFSVYSYPLNNICNWF